MEQRIISGVAHDPSGAEFTIVGVSNMPTDWARIFRTIVNTDLDSPVGEDAEPAIGGGGGRGKGAALPTMSTTPPSVLNLNAYLMYAMGKAARRRLSERLTAHGLRLWHLTALALLADLGPQSKGDMAARLDMNQSDLVKIVNDLVKAGHVECARDPADRRRVEVTLTSEGSSALAHLSADIATVDDDLLAPLTDTERTQLASLLRRVHAHLDPAPASVIFGGADFTQQDPARAGSFRKRSVEDSRIDWNRPAEDLSRLVQAQSHANPSAYTHYNGKRLEVLAATISEGCYDGPPGRIFYREDDGVVIATGGNHGLAVTRIRTEDGKEMPATDYFRSTGGYVTTHN